MKIRCIKCNSELVTKAGFKKLKDRRIQRFKCKNCATYFTGKENYSRLSSKKQIEILNEFKSGKSLNQIALDFNVRLYTVQYLVNKVRKSKPENEQKYQEMMKNRVRSPQEFYRISRYYDKKTNFNNQNSFFRRFPTLSGYYGPMPEGMSRPIGDGFKGGMPRAQGNGFNGGMPRPQGNGFNESQSYEDLEKEFQDILDKYKS